MGFEKQFFVLFFSITVKFCLGVQSEENPCEMVSDAMMSEYVSTFNGNFLYTIFVPKAYKNTWVSPLNVFEALCTMVIGVEGNTLKELYKVMGFPDAISKPDSVYILKKLIDKQKNEVLRKSCILSAIFRFYKNLAAVNSDIVKLLLANAVYVQDGVNIKPYFIEQIKQFPNSVVENVDFSKGEETAEEINSWVSNKTEGLIDSVVSDNFPPNTIIELICTLLFNCSWAQPFPKEATKTGKFFNGEQQIDVQLMNQIAPVRYVNNTNLGLQAIDLDCSGCNYSMNVILPYPDQTIENIIDHMRNTSIKQIMENSAVQNVNITFPKIDFLDKNDLIQPLETMGVHDLFSNEANLTDLTDQKCEVSQMNHYTKLIVNEKRLTAVAVTVTTVTSLAVTTPIKNAIPFCVDKNFIMSIYDHSTGTPMFSGVVYNP